MNVLYTCDDNYVWIMGISMVSLFENNKELEQLNVYLLGENISKENKMILQDIGSKYQREIYIIDVPELDIPKSLVSNRWPLSAYTRLFAGQLLPETLDKILYLDCDTIILGSLKKLEDFPMEGLILAGVKDCIGKTYKQNIGLEKETLYVNAGVLWMDLKKLRTVRISRLMDDYLRKYAFYINYADQDLLNGIFQERIGVLGAEYNVMTIAGVHSYKEIITLRRPTNYYDESDLRQAVQNPKIIHYTTNMLIVRPWYRNTDHPFAQEFQKYLACSPWRDRRLDAFVFTKKESKVIRLVKILPSYLSNKLLGMLHAELKPRYIRSKAKRRRK